MNDDALAVAVRRAKGGDRESLESVVRAIQDDVYGLAIRFLGHPEDARDASQEVLVRVITQLHSFRGESRFKTWAYRVAANHLLNYKRRLRRTELDIDAAHQRLSEAVDESRGSPAHSDPLVVEEMKLACAHGMLLCLDREHRMAYVLGVLLELSGAVAAEVMETSPARYRKRLQRARQRMQTHLSPLCGLVSEDNPCRCASMVGPAASDGIVDPQRLTYATHPVRARALHRETHQLLETTEVLRGDPRYRAPQTFTTAIRELLDRIPGLN
ncbi:MAG: RNA polymerase sigma factor [Myxococcota bacterium]